MTPGALAIRERVRPPSMTRVIASLADMGFVDRAPHPIDGRQVLVSVSESGAELVKAARRARQEWLAERLATLNRSERDILRSAADLMLALVDESPRPKAVVPSTPTASMFRTSAIPTTHGSTISVT